MVSHNLPSAHDLELLSAYLDGELADRERATLEQRLAHETVLQQTLDDLRATVTLVRDLPRLKAPRNFTLDPAVYSRAIPWWQRLFTLELTLQLAGAVGTVASVLLIVLALAAGSGTDDAGSNVANEAEHPAAAEESVALKPTESTQGLRRTATANAITWAARTAIVYDGEGLLQSTIEAQTFHYATLESLELTVTAEVFRRTATAPTVGAAQLPTAGLMAGGETNDGAGYAAESDGDTNDLGANDGLEDAADAIEEAEAAFMSTPTLYSAPNAAFEGSGAVAESVADVAAQPQAPAGVTMLPTASRTPTRTPAATQTSQAGSAAAGMAQASGADEAASTGDAPEYDQAQRERDDEADADSTDAASASEVSPPPVSFADDDNTMMDEDAAPMATSTQPAEAAQSAIAGQPAEQQAATTTEKRIADDDEPSSSWLIGLGVALFVVSVVMFVLGRRKASRV